MLASRQYFFFFFEIFFGKICRGFIKNEQQINSNEMVRGKCKGIFRTC